MKKRRLVLAVVSPKNFYMLYNELREMEIRFEIPASLPFTCFPDDIVLYDERSADLIVGNCERLFVNNNAEKEIILAILPKLIGKDRFKEIAVGIDLGSISAFVAVGDGYFLMKRKVPTEVLGEAIKKVSLIPHEKMIVRIGSWDKTEKVWDIATDIFSMTGASIEIVDEHGTTKIS